MNSANDSDLLRELRTLRLAFHITLVSLIILSGSIGIYLFRQVSLLRRQVEQSARLATKLATDYNENVAPVAMEFERQLKEFAQTHPAFKQQIAKYYAPGTNSPPEAAASPAPAPSPAAH